MSQNRPKLPSIRKILLDPNTEVLSSVKALGGEYMERSGLSSIESSVRGTLSFGTSLIKGTYDMAQSVQGYISDRLDSISPKKKNESSFKTHLKEMQDDAISLFETMKEKAILFTGANPDGTLIDIFEKGTDLSLKRMKLSALALSSFNFPLSEIVRKSIIMDIETAGLSPNAPILQIAMLDMERIKEMKDQSAFDPSALSLSYDNKISPEEQIRRGYLNMDLIPEAIIRDNSPLNLEGKVREKISYKAGTYIPSSLEEFEKKFGAWSSSLSYSPADFYEEFGDESKVIPEEKMKEIRALLEKQGYIDLQNGRRLYSQREAAKWSIIYAKEASRKDSSLVVANLPFESQRVGKLWRYFLDAGENEFNLALDQRNPLNSDPNIISAFGKEIETVRDLTSLLSATWKSTYKLNILDQNNYVFGVLWRNLKNNDKQSEMISLFPEWLKTMSKGLATRDQLDLTKMLYSGLMKTSFLPESHDVFSGAKISWSSKVVLNILEPHVAIGDSAIQGKLLESLAHTVSDIYNVWKGESSNKLIDHLKSFFSATSILLDPQKQRWFDLADLYRKTSLSLNAENFFPGKAGTVEGPAIKLQKLVNLDKEIARMIETVDSIIFPDDQENLFSPLNRKSEIFSVPTEAGETELVSLYTDGQEPFTLQTAKNVRSHTYVDSEGKEFKVSKVSHDYNLEKSVKDLYEKQLAKAREEEPNLLKAEAKARQYVIDNLMRRYSQIETIGSSYTQDELDDSLSRISNLSSQSRRVFLEGHFSGKIGTNFEDIVNKQLASRMAEIRERKPESLPSIDFHREPISKEQIKNLPTTIKKGSKDLIEKIGNIPISMDTSNIEKKFAKFFGISKDLSSWYLASQSKTATVLGYAGIAAAVLGTDYSIDVGNWKLSTKEILAKTGNEKEILPEGHYAKGGSMLSYGQSLPVAIDHTNDNGAALQGLDSSSLDYAVGDGDTVEVLSKGFLGLGRRRLGTVRISGIDTPEVAHGKGVEGTTSGPGDMAYSQSGKNYLSNVLSARTGSQLAITSRETYGRNVGLVTDQQGINYSYEMVAQGLGSVLFREKSYEDTVNQKEFLAAETTAKRQGTGMWSDPFYFGAQSGIAPGDRKGWNKMTPDNMNLFHIQKSPGSTAEQIENMFPPQDPSSFASPSFSDMLSTSNEQNQQSYIKKQMMVNAQDQVLKNAMSMSRGRDKRRR